MNLEQNRLARITALGLSTLGLAVLLGVVLASGPRKTTVASGFGLTIGISFGYYLFMNFGRALGHAGAIPPLPAAWAGNVFYGLLFLMLFARARR